MLNSPTPPRLEDAVCLTEAECILIDPRADGDTLFEHAEMRLEAVSNLMLSLCQLDTPGASADARDLANVAIASRILLADASDLFLVARKTVSRQIPPAKRGARHG